MKFSPARQFSEQGKPYRCRYAVSMQGPRREGLELWMRFLIAVSYLALVASGVSLLLRTGYFVTLAMLVAGWLLVFGLALTWMTLWAQRDESRVGQFGIGSLFFLTVFGAMFFATVRWIISLISAPRSPIDPLEAFVPVAGALVLFGLVSLPFVLGLPEALLWAGVWLIKQPLVRRWLIRRKSASLRAARESGPAHD